MSSPFEVFLEPEARRINAARLTHLSTLGLDLERKRVLEVCAGIGLHAEFFEQRGCEVLCTDGAPANVAEMLRRWPRRRLGVIDLDQTIDLRALGMFDVVFCYGGLYHLRDPDGALARLASVCSGIILLETIVSRGHYTELHPVCEPSAANQAVSGIGCRPTRPWVMAALRRHFGYAYTTIDQPDYPDFVTDWSLISHHGNLRAVFVGSRSALSAPGITELLPIRHRNALPRPLGRRATRVWLDVGAHRGEHSRLAARQDPGLTVHAFEPLPTLYEGLVSLPNYHVYPMAVAERDGMAAFRINRFDAASSLLAIDEAVRDTWSDGHLLHEERVIEVPTTRLDSFLQRYNIQHVEFLKIDAQGADFAVLRSAGDRLADIDRIQLEVAITLRQLYAGAADRATILAYMVGQGFELVETEVQSSGQEENLTFERVGTRTTADGTSAATLGAENDIASGLYRFADALTAHGEVRDEGGCLVLLTDPRQWAYTVVIPVGAPAQDDENGRFRVDLAVKVESGAVQVGVLDREENDFTSSAVVGTSDAWQAVTLITSPLNKAGPLIIRNAYHGGTSTATCRMIAVTQIPELPLEKVQGSGASLEEIAFLADQLRAATLGLIAAPASVVAGTVAATVRDAVLQLRRPLATGGIALIDASATAIGAVFAGLTTAELQKLAKDFSRLRPLAPFPGWRYDLFLETDELLTLMRYGIWLALSKRPEAEPVVLPWHGGTRLAIHFGNDLSLAIFVHGCLEPNEFAFVDTVLRPGMTVIDAGANEGAYTAFFAGRVRGNEGRVLAIEPSPRELVRLENNIGLNGADRVQVVPAALAEQEGEATLLLAEDHHAGQNTLGGIIYPGVSQAGRVIVPATTLDVLATTHRLDRVDIVKLDVEGAEIRALSGGTGLLERFKPLLLMEASDASLRWQGGSVRKLLDVLKDAGYLPFCFDTATGLPVLLQDDAAISDNLIAVHADRRFGL